MRRGFGRPVARRRCWRLSARGWPAQDTVRIGVLKFGTVNWEVDTIIHNKLDEANGFKLEPVVLASNDATRIAINAGEVDVIVSDWLFVSRQRAEGLPLTFVPFRPRSAPSWSRPTAPLRRCRTSRARRSASPAGRSTRPG